MMNWLLAVASALALLVSLWLFCFLWHARRAEDDAEDAEDAEDDAAASARSDAATTALCLAIEGFTFRRRVDIWRLFSACSDDEAYALLAELRDDFWRELARGRSPLSGRQRQQQPGRPLNS